MSKRNSVLLVEDMLLSGQKIAKYVAGMTYDNFISDDKTIDAVLRNFEIIGEAASRVSPNFQDNCQPCLGHNSKGIETASSMSISEWIITSCGIS